MPLKTEVAQRPIPTLQFYLNLCRRTGRKGKPFNAGSIGINPDSPILQELIDTGKLIPCRTLSSGQMFYLSDEEKQIAQSLHSGGVN